MAKNANLVALAACCIFLVLVSHAEAQQCPSVQISKFATCQGNVRSGSCPANSPCYNALKAYKNLDTRYSRTIISAAEDILDVTGVTDGTCNIVTILSAEDRANKLESIISTEAASEFLCRCCE
ncbi:hypothetical protein R1flu_024782 [Riccia fluitans]|uniref:Uncharacterized protein n=1 Tax=Riccia fluitans TaxID=41844 RepID=A0ABD1XWB2_9MARC